MQHIVTSLIWRHRCGSILVRAMACCLTAPSLYLNQLPKPKLYFPWWTQHESVWNTHVSAIIPYCRQSLRLTLTYINMKTVRLYNQTAIHLQRKCPGTPDFKNMENMLIDFIWLNVQAKYLIQTSLSNFKWDMALWKWPKCPQYTQRTCWQTVATQHTGLTNHQWGLVVFTWGQFHRKCSRCVCLVWVRIPLFNTLRARQMDAISQTPFSNAFSWMKMFEYRLKFHWSLFFRVQLINILALVQIMAWRRPGDKPLSEPMVVSLPTHICVARPQWVNIAATSPRGQYVEWTVQSSYQRFSNLRAIYIDFSCSDKKVYSPQGVQ